MKTPMKQFTLIAGVLALALLAAAFAARAASPEELRKMAKQPKNTAPIDATLAARLGGEPLCRVGIVLEEDKKPRMEAVLPQGEFMLTIDGRDIPIAASEPMPLIFEVAGGQIVLTRPDGLRVGSTAGHMRLVRTDQPGYLEPNMGVLFKSCVTGRGFHWQKEVDFTFPYHFEIHHRNGQLIIVNEIPMEPYLTCVVTSEMSKDCPTEFIKAQATAARSWMQVFLKDKHRNEPFTICNDDDCQRYQGTTWLSQEVADAVAACSGMYLVEPDGAICPAYYSKSCGGIMEKGTNVFGAGAESLSADCDAPTTASPTFRFNPVTEETIREWVEGEWVAGSDSYCSPNVVPETTLKTFIGAVDDAGQYYRWKVTYTREELEGMLRQKAGIADIKEFVDFKPGPRGNSGRLMALSIVYHDDAGTTKTHEIRKEYNIRKALHEKFLFSGAFVWDFEKDAAGKISTLTLTGAGWGHGAGLCQIGALGMSIKGVRYEDILKHYYDGAELKRAY